MLEWLKLYLKKMKNSGNNIIIFVAIAGLILGGVLLATPKKSVSPSNTNGETQVKEDAALVNREDAPYLGAKEPKVTVVVFSDYLCPYCKQLHGNINQQLEKNGDKVRVYFRNFVVHSQAEISAKAAEAAFKQGKFKEANDALFNISDPSEDTILAEAKNWGVDMDKFKSDLGSDEISKKLDKDQQDALSLNLSGTPSVYINGKFLTDPSTFDSVIEDELKK